MQFKSSACSLWKALWEHHVPQLCTSSDGPLCSWRLLSLWYIVFQCHPFTSLPVLALISKDWHSYRPKLHICHRIAHGFLKVSINWWRYLFGLWRSINGCFIPYVLNLVHRCSVAMFWGFFCQHGPKMFPNVKCLLSSKFNPVPWLQAGVVSCSFTESFNFWQR